MATIPTHGFIFVFGLSLSVVVSYGDDGGVTSASKSSTSECDDLQEVCQQKIDVFDNDTICRNLKDAVDCLNSLNNSCHHLQNSEDYYYYYYDDALGQQGGNRYRNSTNYYYKPSDNRSILDLILDMQREYKQKCRSTAKSSAQDNASVMRFRPQYAWMWLLCLLIPIVLTLILAQ